MATTDTVLQPGAEDLSGFTGPAGPTGPQGATGATGAGADMNIMSINCRYYGLTVGMTNIVSGNFQSSYILQNGTKFKAVPHTFTTDVSGGSTLITGSLSNFLVTPATYGVQITKMKELWSGAIPAFSQSSQYSVEIHDRQNSSLTWKIMYKVNGSAVSIQDYTNAGITELEFNLLITA
tara:strand:+ start:13525 stop:14061 length:537 start_codon:yes stop_codon:yes gene_type:complete